MKSNELTVAEILSNSAVDVMWSTGPARFACNAINLQQRIWELSGEGWGPGKHNRNVYKAGTIYEKYFKQEKNVPVIDMYGDACYFGHWGWFGNPADPENQMARSLSLLLAAEIAKDEL